MEAGYPFFSASADAFSSDTTLRKAAWCADIICGKQATTMSGRGAVRHKYTVFPLQMQEALAAFTSAGGNVLVSGANLGTDVWDSVFPVKTDSTFRANSMDFVQKTLGYKWICNYASKSARVSPVPEYLCGFGTGGLSGELCFANRPNSRIYCVETPDGRMKSIIDKHINGLKGKTAVAGLDITVDSRSVEFDTKPVDCQMNASGSLLNLKKVMTR